MKTIEIATLALFSSAWQTCARERGKFNKKKPGENPIFSAAVARRRDLRRDHRRLLDSERNKKIRVDTVEGCCFETLHDLEQ